MEVVVVAIKTPILIYFLAILAGFLAALGDSLLNMWVKALPGWVVELGISKSMFLGGGLIFWNASLVIFIMMLQRGFLAQSVMLFIVSNCVFALLMSQMWFGEILTNLQWVAIAMAIGALVLMEMGGAK